MRPERVHPLAQLGRLTFQADDEALAREVRDLLHPDSMIRISGKKMDVAGYLKHVTELRSGMSGGSITVVDEVWGSSAEPSGVAARVVVRMTLKNGPAVHGEAHLIGRLDADGRLTKLVEIGRLIDDTDDPAETR
ncbi:hypothetical protein [Amycolatopsis jejuensis]|uniref:hypothetical protein n=1 Tax=Amycolatopsis jejuensis TaxID=330084 RepID=UPI000524D457|nr:hypothetical protein [Amycolatopsis jejuensis]